MASAIGGFQEKAKGSSLSAVTLALKVITSLFLGLTFALIGDEVFAYEWISFTLVLVAITGALLRIMKNWTIGRVLIFDLICVLLGLLLRMYILIAPG
ncbi:MAG: hypothetical protein AB7F86_11580 [Bdellovibrionales bacterium]